MKFYVYRHIRLDTNTPFYVGKGSGKRATVKAQRNYYWNNIVNLVGYRVDIIKDNLKEKESYELEEKIIKLYKKYGYCEANLIDGGIGGGCGRTLSKETKEKLSIIATKQWSSIDSRKKMSNTLKEYFKNPENLIKASLCHGGKEFKVYKAILIQHSNNKGRCKIYKRGDFVGSWVSQAMCAKELNINRVSIVHCIKKNAKTAGGYLFEEVL